MIVRFILHILLIGSAVVAGCFLPCNSVYSQSSATVSGFLLDEESGEALRYGQVINLETGTGAVANVYGFFSLQQPIGPVELIIKYAFFEPDTISFFLRGDTSLTVRISPDLALSTVEITDRIMAKDNVLMSSYQVSIEKIKQMPALLGEVDVLKALQLLPGVQGGNEGTAGLYVRGGNTSQNLILLDGVPLYYVNHLGGFFSVFDAEAIDQVHLMTGGFPARYGGRTSSVLDIRMKEGNKETFHGSASIGIVAARALIEGPLQKGKSSFLISARRTYLDVFTRAITRSNSGGERDLGYQFYDLNAKINYQFSENSRLFLSAYAGNDQVSIRFSEEERSDDLELSRVNDSRLNWGNQLVALRWNKIWNSKLFSNLTTTYTRYRYETSFLFESLVVSFQDSVQNASLAQFQSGIKEWGTQLQFDYYPVANHDVKFGLENKFYQFSPGSSGVQLDPSGPASIDTLIGSSPILGWAVSAFVEDTWTPTPRSIIQVGTRVNFYGVESTIYPILEPRISVNYKLNSQLSLKASVARMSQFVHLLSNSDAGIPTDLWVPSTADIPIERSWTSALGMAGSIYSIDLEWSIEGYYRTMDGLIEYRAGQTLAGSTTDWQNQIESGGKGRMYGLEVFLQKNVGSTTASLGYTLAWSNRVFENINGGIPFPYKYDNRHSVDFFISHSFSKRFRLSAIWSYQSGNAVTLATARHNSPILFEEAIPGAPGTEINIFEDGRNSFRIRDYHRLDISAIFTKERRLYTRNLTLGIYNAYGRRNPYFYFFDETLVNGEVVNQLRQFSLFPAIPSINYAVTF